MNICRVRLIVLPLKQFVKENYMTLGIMIRAAYIALGIVVGVWLVISGVIL